MQLINCFLMSFVSTLHCIIFLTFDVVPYPFVLLLFVHPWWSGWTSFLGSLNCLSELCTVLLRQFGKLFAVLHFPYSLFTCQKCLFKDHPALLDSFLLIFLLIRSFFFFFSLICALHLLKFAFPELIIFPSSASFLFLRKEIFFYYFHRGFNSLRSLLTLPLLKIELKRICLMIHFLTSIYLQCILNLFCNLWLIHFLQQISGKLETCLITILGY